MTKTEAIQKICVALDVPNIDSACNLARQLREHVGFVKVGMELYTAEGPQIVKTLASMGLKVFLDLKFHDIPNTVAGVSRVVSPLGVSIFNLHAGGGQEMMEASLRAATEFAAKEGVPRPQIIAVTVLTSIDQTTFKIISESDVTVSEHVIHLARLTKEAGLDGVVASPHEINQIRSACGKDFLIVTPGIRPAGGLVGDQKRVATPEGAILAGADLLVIGRPITAAKDPIEAADRIIDEICRTQI